MEKNEPEWLETPLENTENKLAFRALGSGDKASSARSFAVTNLFENVMASMDIIVNPDTLDSVSSEAIASFQRNLDFVLRNPSSTRVKGFTVARQGVWSDDSGEVTYVADVMWERLSLFQASDQLIKTLRNDSPQFENLIKRAETSEVEGNGYESALIWASAAQVAEKNQNMAGVREAFRQISRVLDLMTYKLESAPINPSVGVRQTKPVVFQVMLEGQPVENAEFVVTYPRRTREGDSAKGMARIYSDGEGLVRFLPPEIPFSGMQKVTLAPSIEPFTGSMKNKDNTWMETIILKIETARIEAIYEAKPRYLDAATGVALLETDLAGKPLSSFTAGGLIDILQKAGASISLMDLDSSELTNRNESSLLRGLKADKRFSGKYDWIIHGKVSLVSFEQEGNTYVVGVEGTLILSDINRQSNIYRSVVATTSRAEDGQQAINSAFRQIGRTFATEIIQKAP